MRVHFVPGTGAEVDDTQIEILARLRRQQRLPRHGTTGEQGSIDGLSRDFGGLVYLHWRFSSSLVIPRWPSSPMVAHGGPVSALSSGGLLRRRAPPGDVAHAVSFGVLFVRGPGGDAAGVARSIRDPVLTEDECDGSVQHEQARIEPV